MRTIRLKWRKIIVSAVILTLCIFIIFCNDKNHQMNTISEVKSSRDLSQEVVFNAKEMIPSLLNLVGKRVPNVAFYVWCQNRTIHFVNYLSILSVWKMMTPDSIEFYSLYYPLPRKADKYNDWLEDLEHKIPGFVVLPMPDYVKKEQCGLTFGLDLLLDRGGLYVNENTVLTHPFHEMRQNDFVVGITNFDNTISFVMSTSHNRPQIRKLRLYMKKSLKNPTELKNNIKCENVDENLNLIYNFTPCVQLDEIYPKDIMYEGTYLCSILRWIFYDDANTGWPMPRIPGNIPKIIHLVWFNKKEMTFLMFLSLKSVLNIIKPDKVFIHGDGYLEGELLQTFENDSRITMVKREPPHYIFGKQVLYTQHKSDVIRADVLLKYGGVYMDWDVLWLKPIDKLLQSRCDAIVNFDHMPYPHYPDAMNLGVLMAKPRSIFIQKWQEALVNYRSKDFFYNAILLPYKIYERYPQDICIEKHLQVMCFNGKCHPTFDPNFKRYEQDQPFDWRTDVYAIHITHPDPPEFNSIEQLQNSSSLFAQIGQYILKQSNDDYHSSSV